MKPLRTGRAAVALLALPLAVTLTACGGGGGTNGSSADDSASRTAPAAEPGAPGGAADSSGTEGSATGSGGKAQATVATVLQRSIIATGQLQVSSAHLPDARQNAINAATAVRGYVGDEQSRSDGHGKLERVDLTLRVPSASFEKVLDELAALGTVRHRQQSVEDVTAQVIDNNVRVKAQKASVASIRRLLARATTIGEIVSIEDQLARRQADLDSLEQQQKWLADQTSMSTIQLTLTRPPAARATDHHRTGFVGGLAGGWHALGRTAVVVGTAVGAVLPFAVVLAVIGVPAWLVLRRRRTVATPPPAPGV